MTDKKTPAQGTRPNEAVLAIPDDAEQSVYRFIIVAAKRARQLQSGARPKVQMGVRKPTRVAVDETRRGLIPYVDPENAAQEPLEEEEGIDQ